MIGQTLFGEEKGERGSNFFRCALHKKKHCLLNGGQGLISTGFNVVRFYKRTEKKTPEKNEKIRNEKKDINLLTVPVMMENKCSFLVVKRFLL